MNRVALYTAAGQMSVIYVKDFAPMVAHQQIDQGIVKVAEANYAQPFGTFNHQELAKIEQTFKSVEYKLAPFFKLSDIELMASRERFLVDDKIREEALKAIEREFKIMVAQKKPDFFIKDLNLQALEDLANKYAMNFGSGDFYGVEVRFSQYQKFFAIVSPEDFKFFSRRERLITELNTNYSGKLVDLRPEKWVMGRYENLEYLKELSARSIYQAPNKVDPELMAEALMARERKDEETD